VTAWRSPVALQKHTNASVALFEKARAFARGTGKQNILARALYNLACAYAETDKLLRASDALKHAIEIDRVNPRSDGSTRSVCIDRVPLRGSGRVTKPHRAGAGTHRRPRRRAIVFCAA
jgi:hypothetical protein